jgi:hypothetical protein
MQMDTVLYFTETWKALMLPFVDLNAKINWNQHLDKTDKYNKML